MVISSPSIMLYHQKPEHFKADMEVSEAIIECGGEVLLVQRSDHCSEGGTWCGPGGKLDPGESHSEALIREIDEEIGVDISGAEHEELFTKYFYFKEKYIAIRFYKVRVQQKPEIILNDEHQNYIGEEPRKALNMNLNEDFDIILKEIYSL